MIFSTLKRWAIAAGAALIAGLYFALRIARLKGQRDRAKEKAQRQADARAAVERNQAQEQAVDQARQETRRQAEDVEQEAQDLRRQGRRPDSFGDKRLRR